MLPFKNFFTLNEFRIPGPKPERGIIPLQTSPKDRWYIFNIDGKYTLNDSPCFDGESALGHFTFSPYRDLSKVTSASQLKLYTKHSLVKKELLHLARGKTLLNLDQAYADKFLSEIVDLTVQRLNNIKPDIIIYLDSVAPFNKKVISQYKEATSLNVANIFKNNFNYISTKYVNPSVLMKELMVDTHYTKGPQSGRIKIIPHIISLAYMKLLDDIKNKKPINKILKDGSVQEVEGQTKLSIDLISSILASNYTPDTVKEYLESINPITNKKNKESYSIKDIESKLVNPLKDARTIKQFLLPNNFFVFDTEIWKDLTSGKIVVLDDNINTEKTFTEINRAIKQINPKLTPEWLVGVKFLGVDITETPKCTNS